MQDEEYPVEYDGGQGDYPQTFDNGGLTVQEKFAAMQQLASQGAELANKLTNAYVRCQEVKAQTEQMRIMSNERLQKAAMKFMAFKETLTATFNERGIALGKFYDTLDSAVESGDKDLIIAAMSSISDVVTKSPLKDIQALVARFDDPNDDSEPLEDLV